MFSIIGCFTQGGGFILVRLSFAFQKYRRDAISILYHKLRQTPKLIGAKVKLGGTLKRRALLCQTLGNSRSLRITVSPFKIKLVYDVIFLCDKSL
jgi:hypothetical protein